MPKDLINISDSEWKSVNKEIQRMPEEQKDMFKLGYSVNRFARIEVMVEEDADGGAVLSCKQSLRIEALLKEVLMFWQ